MLKTIKKYFEQHMTPESSEDIDHQLRLSTAALLVEMMQQDDHEHEAEQVAIKSALQEKFALSETETHELYALAKQEVSESTDYYQFTNLIARNFSPEKKVKVIEYLWEIAYADCQLDPYEEHMVRRIADLIYVSHADFMRTKNLVQERLDN